MTFSRYCLNNLLDHNINGEILSRTTDDIKDLGELFDPKLTFIMLIFTI